MTYHPTYHPTYPYASLTPTPAELRARRLECVHYALDCYDAEQRCHPRDAVTRAKYHEARIYWIAQAFHAHGELLARR